MMSLLSLGAVGTQVGLGQLGSELNSTPLEARQNPSPREVHGRSGLTFSGDRLDRGFVEKSRRQLASLKCPWNLSIGREGEVLMSGVLEASDYAEFMDGMKYLSGNLPVGWSMNYGKVKCVK